MKKFKITEDFKAIPIGRPDGERFCKQILLPVYNSGEPVIFDFNDNVMGYGSSFLEEAFGGLVRETNISPEQFSKLFLIEHKHQFYADMILEYVKSAYEVLLGVENTSTPS